MCLINYLLLISLLCWNNISIGYKRLIFCSIKVVVHKNMQVSQSNSRNFNANRSSPVKVRTKMKKILDPWGPYVPMWNTIFLMSSVIAVSIDPLLLYIPVIDEDKKCLGTDINLKIIAPLLRCVSDLSYLVHIISKIRTTLSQRNGLMNNSYWEAARRICWPSILLDVIAIVPLPQVLHIYKVWHLK